MIERPAWLRAGRFIPKSAEAASLLFAVGQAVHSGAYDR
jgi:hypothetical protein